MILSPDLERLQKLERSYEPSDEVKQKNSEKTLITLIGPTAVGKSTLAEEIIRLGGSAFSEVYSSLTRARRSDDPPQYTTADEGFTIERAKELIRTQAVTNYSVHPSGNIYATVPENFPAPYNLLPLLPGSLAAMKRAGFKSVHAIYLVTATEAFKKQLSTRATDPSFSARLNEGRQSLAWALEHADELLFVENIHGQPHIAAARILSLLEERQPAEEKERGITLARAMLNHLESPPI